MCTVHGCMAVGEDPMNTALREFTEELTVYSVDNIGTLAGKAQVVPVGVTATGMVPYLNLHLSGETLVYGELEYLGVNENTLQIGVIEVMMVWNLAKLDRPHLCFIQSEEMPDGSMLGSNFRVLDPQTFQYLGDYSGQQGFLPAGLEQHSALQNALSRLSQPS